MNVEAIRGKVDLVAVIGQYIRLRKRGVNWSGLCCFHTDHSPSLDVNPNKQLWICRSCGAAGDVFSFLQRIETLDFKAAVQRAAEICGVQIEPEGNPLSPAEIREERKRMAEARILMEEAEHYRQVVRPARLWINDSPPSPQQVLGAYQVACREDLGMRSWIRADMQQVRQIVDFIIEALRRGRPAEASRVFEAARHGKRPESLRIIRSCRESVIAPRKEVGVEWW